jgi:hypothetical protein
VAQPTTPPRVHTQPVQKDMMHAHTSRLPKRCGHLRPSCTTLCTKLWPLLYLIGIQTQIYLASRCPISRHRWRRELCISQDSSCNGDWPGAYYITRPQFNGGCRSFKGPPEDKPQLFPISTLPEPVSTGYHISHPAIAPGPSPTLGFAEGSAMQ